MKTIVFDEPVASPFHFRSTARSHGWVALAPFEWDEGSGELCRVHRLRGGQVVRLRMGEERPGENSQVRVKVDSPERLTLTERGEVSLAVRRMLRLDENLSGFHAAARSLGGGSWTLQAGEGRLLRCPTLFEDFVLTLCTTNIQWAGTKRLVGNLVSHLGDPFPGQDSWWAFPTSEAIAAAGPDFLRDEIRMGYRSQYLWDLAVAVVEEDLDLERFENGGLDSETLFHELKAIRGFGDYAAGTLLMILGRYDRLAIDSEMRTFVSKKYYGGQPVGDEVIHKLYEPWGEWKYLAYWFDPLGE